MGRARETSRRKSHPGETESRALPQTLGIALGLAVLAGVLYAPAVGFDFVNFDDDVYVRENRRVLSGLTWDGVRWAFSTETAANWHPLTWISLMADAELSGPGPRGFHRTNVILHAASAALLFLAFHALTGARLRSGLVAALFAVHPAHVESVAWIAERKDVLSGLFMMLALLAYARFVHRRSRASFIALLLVYAAGLLSKPMLVSLPAVFLVLDFWPLRRLGELPRSAIGLLVEKAPLIAMAAASCVVTIHAQAAGGAVYRLDQLSLVARAANAVVAYTSYLRMLIWPSGLAVFYPHGLGSLAAAQVLGALAVFVAVSALAYRFRASRPWLAAGWSWYVIMLLPVIGLVQVGSQAMADRYTYLPSIGVFAAAAWSLPASTSRLGRPLAGVVLAMLAALCLVTRAQLVHWRNGVSLFERAVHVTGPNAKARAGLGNALAMQGRPDAAVGELEQALSIDPRDGVARCDFAAALAKVGRTEEAVREFEDGLRRVPDNARCRANFGTLLLQEQNLLGAQREFEVAVRLAPDDVSALKNLGVVLAMQGRFSEAVTHFSEALRLAPNDATVRQNLERARRRLTGKP